MNDQLPSHARVIVIGGGVMGCSTLYHLVKLGVGDAVLLERERLTCGTTWHSAAQVRQLRSTNNLTQLIRYSTELYSSLESETGQSTGWIETGSLSIATNADRLTHIRRQASLAKLFGVETHELSPAEAAEMLAVPIGTVMSRLSRARQMMKKALLRSAVVKPQTENVVRLNIKR